jgi:hypothetical protein
MTTKVLAIVLSLIIFFFVIELIRREKLTFKYAFGWLIVSVLGVFSSIFDKLLFKIAHLLGFELPSNFIFFTLLSVFIFLSLLLTIFLCQEHKRNITIAQKLSLLEFEINELKKKKLS